MMLLGTLTIWTALALTVASIFAYLQQPKSPLIGTVPLGRKLFFGAAGCVLAAAAVLQTLLQTHRFDVNYVYHYSARELNPFYLFATFWAGQEGSFLLWSFWLSILGVILTFKAGPVMERRVMPFYAGILAFLMLILTVKNPFVPYGIATSPDQQTDQWHAWITQISFILSRGLFGHGLASAPTNGMGLQPLLENPWMVIHPPTLFLGFSSTAVTFVYAIAALAYGDTEDWYRRTWPWALFCVSILGFGVMLGGYWAYEVLGWGGFWGWDPVENGPLVPWLIMVAFVHAVQVQRVRGGLKKSVLLLGLLPFLATLYETFLTRTGILSNFSNHSFSTLGGVANGIILYAMLGAMIVSIGLLVWRGKTIVNESDVWENATSKEFGFTMAVIITVVCALITGIGMSAPLITQAGVSLHMVAHQSSVQDTYYNRANFPVAILLGFGMAIAPYLTWKGNTSGESVKLSVPSVIAFIVTTALVVENFHYHFHVLWCDGLMFGSLLATIVIVGKTVLPQLATKPSGSSYLGKLEWPWSLAVAITVLVYFLARRNQFFITAPMLFLFASSLFALLANGAFVIRWLRSSGFVDGLRVSGGMVAHAGAAILLLGIVTLVSFQRIEDINLVEDHPSMLRSMPFTLTYTGMTSTMRDPANDLLFHVERNDTAAPVAGLRFDPNAPMTAAEVDELKLHEPAVESFNISMPFAIRKQELTPTLLARPAIQHHWWGDLYFAMKGGPDPVSPTQLIRFSLNQGESKTILGYTYTFHKFEVRPDQAAIVSAAIQQNKMPDLFPVEALIDVKTPTGQVYHLTPQNITDKNDPMGPEKPEFPLPKPTLGTWWGITFVNMNVTTNQASFFVRDLSMAPLTRYTIEVSTRPMIWLVWVGTVMMTLGGLAATRRRVLEGRVSPVSDPVAVGEEPVRKAGRAERRAKVLRV